MRNTYELPLTLDELHTAMDIAVEERGKLRYIGDITAVCLNTVRDYLREHPEVAQDILRFERRVYEKPSQAAPA